LQVLLGVRDKTGNWTQGAPVTVTNAVVVFMTDGQDSTYYKYASFFPFIFTMFFFMLVFLFYVYLFVFPHSFGH
jgi:hypothetical protein